MQSFETLQIGRFKKNSDFISISNKNSVSVCNLRGSILLLRIRNHVELYLRQPFFLGSTDSDSAALFANITVPE